MCSAHNVGCSGNNNNNSNYSRPSGPTADQINTRQAAAEHAARRALEEQAQHDAGAEATAQKANDAEVAREFQQRREALSQLRGLSQDFGSVDSGYKGLNDTNRDSAGFKTLPDVNTDSSVVDARNVPTGLPKSVADEIPDTAAGNRVRKGFEAIMDHDWNVAHAWFQDALNHDPGNAGIQRLVELAEFTMKQAEHPDPSGLHSKPVADTSAQDEAAMAMLDQQLDDQMNADLAKALNDFNRNYSPKHPEPPREKLKANWRAFFDAIFKKGQRYSAVGAVRD